MLDIAAQTVHRIGRGRFGNAPKGQVLEDSVLVEYSVLEVAVPLLADRDEDEIGDVALSLAIDAIQLIQRAYHRACHEPITLVTRERLPALVPAFVREFAETGANPDDPYTLADGPFFVAVNLHEWVGLPGAGQEVIDSERLDISLQRVAENGPHEALTEFRREASVAFWLTGDYRASITWTATAAELLLDEVLQSMMWEEGRRPEDCVSDFTNNMSIVKRVKTLYPPRLGGSWGDPAEFVWTGK
ncbi:hypothetical protein ACWGID_16080 [Kribbella sp. NPDC054772]